MEQLLVNVPVRINVNAPKELVLDMMEQLNKDDWTNGRNKFSQETVEHGLRLAVQEAINDARWRQAVAQFSSNSCEDIENRQKFMRMPVGDVHITVIWEGIKVREDE